MEQCDREIDWFACSGPLEFSLPLRAPFVLSDHKALELAVPLTADRASWLP